VENLRTGSRPNRSGGLILRGKPRLPQTIEDYRRFIDTLVARRNKAAWAAVRRNAPMKPLCRSGATTDFTEIGGSHVHAEEAGSCIKGNFLAKRARGHQLIGRLVRCGGSLSDDVVAF